MSRALRTNFFTTYIYQTAKINLKFSITSFLLKRDDTVYYLLFGIPTNKKTYHISHSRVLHAIVTTSMNANL